MGDGQSLGQSLDPVSHVPAARGTYHRTKSWLDTVRWTDPIRVGDIAGVIGSRNIVGRSRTGGQRNGFDGPARPMRLRTPKQPLVHEVRHERRWHDCIAHPAERADG